MTPSERDRLRSIRAFPSLVKYLKEDLGWPIESDDFEDLTFDYEPEELGIDSKTAAKIECIKQLRPLETHQPWGIFFVKFSPRRLPVVALRRILGQLVFRKRASAKKAEQAAWNLHDLLFISNYGDGEERQINLAHFAENEQDGDLPTLKVLGWDGEDTDLHLDHVAEELESKLTWPEDPEKIEDWRERWSSAFTLRHREVITTSKDLAVRLADLARGIRRKVNSALAVESEKGPLRRLMTAFKDSLIHDLDEDDFADMYAQTIAYGLLTARVSRPAGLTPDNLADMVPITNPFLKELMETFLHVGGRRRNGKGHTAPGLDFDELGVNDVVALLRAANMEAVLRDFGNRNRDEDPAIRFYEDFLREYDANKRMQRGVFYTPKPVVSYIVRSVHLLLRTEFGLEDGLASTVTWGEIVNQHKGITIPAGMKASDAFVQILDPATGTATFLVETIDVIYRTMMAKWKRQGHTELYDIPKLWNDYVPKHLLPRIHGYELMMAPYAIAHMKLGLKLYETGYRFGSEERARIYLTNALEPPQDFSDRLAFDAPALAHEAQAVNAIKRSHRFSIVIGNPPYAGISSNMTEDAQRIVDAYKIVDGKALNERKLWLQDDYVKFIRTAQTTIERAGAGILGYITNHGYLDNPTFRGMRQSLMGTFQGIRVLDLHGNANKSEQSPDGSEDKNVFDIRQGVAVLLAARAGRSPSVQHADLWGLQDAKYHWLSKHDTTTTQYTTLLPDSPYYFFEPQNTDGRAEYDAGWKLNELMPENCAGFITARDHFVVDLDRDTLLRRMADFADPDVSTADIRSKYFSGCGSSRYPDGDTRSWKVPDARKRIRNDKHWRNRVRVCSYRPFDHRHIYWVDWMVDWPRTEIMGQMLHKNNIAFHVCRQSVSDAWGHVLVTRGLTDDCYVSNKTRERGYTHPLFLFSEQGGLGSECDRKHNLSEEFLAAVADALGLDQTPESLPVGVRAEDIFHYIYALLYSPSYRHRYAEFLKIDFPRIPVTKRLDVFTALAQCGGALAALHLMEFTVGVRDESRHRYPQLTEYTGGKAEVDKITWSKNTVWIDKAQTRGFKGVPEAVWNFHVGGYQVCEKWLKDRRGRTLSTDDRDHYHRIVIALHETIRLMKEIDAVIEKHGGWPGAFAHSGKSEA